MPATTAPTPQGPLLQRTRERAASMWMERGIVATLFLSSTVATLTTAAIFWTMLSNGWTFFEEVSVREFLFGRRWAPDFNPQGFGSLPLLKGTIQIALGATVIGVPLGVGSALYISEFASPRLRSVLKPTIEILAGIPSIVFGLVAVFILAPFLADTVCDGVTYTALAASIALGVMVIPIIASISEDAIRAVPRDLREGAVALGATKWEATWKVTLPAARSGITAATILGFSRAIGETMVVTLVAGLQPSVVTDWNYCHGAATITSYIANRAGGDLPQGSTIYLSIFAVGLLLFAMTFAINLLAQFILARYRRRFA